MKFKKNSHCAGAVRAALAIASATLLWTGTANAANNPFTATGHIKTFTLDQPGNVLSGAHMTVDGINIQIPANTVMVMPGSYFTPEQAFLAPDGITEQAQSGLAIEDPNRQPYQMFEADITGNIVNGVHIAGLVTVYPVSLNDTSGYIRRIDNARGELCVGSSPTPLGLDASGNPIPCRAPNARVRLNDPTGRFGVAQSTTDKRFQLDPANQPIKSVTGYPMCIPRYADHDDSLCPAKNRPAGLGTFVMTGPNIGQGSQGGGIPQATITSCNTSSPPDPTKCDPHQQAPFIVGDYVDYAGLLMNDSDPVNDPFYVSAYALTANVGIYTQPGVDPAYVTQEVLFLGTGPTSTCPGECQLKLRVLGFTTDPSRVDPNKNFWLNVYAIDVDNNGGQTLRLIQKGSLANARREAFYGRYRIDVALKFPQPANNLLVPTPGGTTREVMVRIDPTGTAVPNGTPVPIGPTVANGLVQNQYILPQPEFLFPELTLAGTATVPNNFQCLPFLVQGWGTSAGPTGAMLTNIGRLNPWPSDASPPMATDCTQP